MVIADFQIDIKVNRLRFSQKIFLVANTKFVVILKMFFLKISNPDVSFYKKTLMWKFYTPIKALFIT